MIIYFNPFSTNQFSSTSAISTLFASAKAKWLLPRMPMSGRRTTLASPSWWLTQLAKACAIWTHLIHHAHGRKIAHADGADFADCLIFFQHTPCAVAVAVRLMNQYHINAIQIQTTQRSWCLLTKLWFVSCVLSILQATRLGRDFNLIFCKSKKG